MKRVGVLLVILGAVWLAAVQRVPEAAKPPVPAARKPTLLVFTATWCGPCKQLHETLSRCDTAAYDVGECDIDKDQQKAMLYSVKTVPTLVVLGPDWQERKRLVGAVNREELQRWLDANK